MLILEKAKTKNSKVGFQTRDDFLSAFCCVNEYIQGYIKGFRSLPKLTL
jgi:hypothetical protein